MNPPRRGEDFSGELAEKGWYHSFALPDGARIEGYNKLEILEARWARFPIPQDLRGKRVLDIGAWDGWFSFEAERRGAEVTAVDNTEVANFLRIHRRLASRVDYRICDIYDLPAMGLGRFDIVFLLGVLYHLRHPLLALEMVCGLARDIAIVESFVTDADTWQEHRADIPTMEFYETDELGNQLDNWTGPTVSCLMAMCRAAGFARVELLHAGGLHAGVVCYRKWEPPPAHPRESPPELLSVANTRTFGINFSARREEYITCWFRTPRETVGRSLVCLEVDGLGAAALYTRRDAEGIWLANFRLPPGLAAGWQIVRLRFRESGFGAERRIAVDVPLHVDRIGLKGVCDGSTWAPGEVRLGGRACVTCWASGLPENADRSNVRGYLGDVRLAIEYLGETDAEGWRQINALVPADAAPGERMFRVECAGVSSESCRLRVV